MDASNYVRISEIPISVLVAVHRRVVGGLVGDPYAGSKPIDRRWVGAVVVATAPDRPCPSVTRITDQVSWRCYPSDTNAGRLHRVAKPQHKGAKDDDARIDG
jgi:hypothetical protein